MFGDIHKVIMFKFLFNKIDRNDPIGRIPEPNLLLASPLLPHKIIILLFMTIDRVIKHHFLLSLINIPSKCF